MNRRADDGPVGDRRWPTLLLAAALIVPFVAKFSLGHEPYPAAILPEGGSRLVTSDGSVTYDVTALYGQDEDGELVEIDAGRFLDPLPLHFLLYVSRTQFGLADLADPVIRIRGTDLSVAIPRRHPTSEQRQEVADWLRERLREQRLNDRILVIRQIEHRTDIDTGDVLSTRILDENSIDL